MICFLCVCMAHTIINREEGMSSYYTTDAALYAYGDVIQNVLRCQSKKPSWCESTWNVC